MVFATQEVLLVPQLMCAHTKPSDGVVQTSGNFPCVFKHSLVISNQKECGHSAASPFFVLRILVGVKFTSQVHNLP